MWDAGGDSRLQGSGMLRLVSWSTRKVNEGGEAVTSSLLETGRGRPEEDAMAAGSWRRAGKRRCSAAGRHGHGPAPRHPIFNAAPCPDTVPPAPPPRPRMLKCFGNQHVGNI